MILMQSTVVRLKKIMTDHAHVLYVSLKECAWKPATPVISIAKNINHGGKSKMASEEIKQIKEQEQFVEWLKSKRMYNPMESAYTMQKMHWVWQAMKEDKKDGI